ncbi:peptidoglycan-binding protein [Oculatella sp. FACHB-28]|uniref:peptidoglycan-binding protein n=1 Tax=Oculatella sp. FACHB-28 TaxID=2692845 RepID=UPI001683ECDE|nr:peptidoglycan-binding protein [Oculatella sp. FACHB-28]MBD2056969.1 peptidoglycan-binding protein [Oculatella sp. FACHB-28]
MEFVKNVIDTGVVDTGRVAGLSRQIITEMNSIAEFGNVLFSFDDLENMVFKTGEPGRKVNPVLQLSAKEALRAALRDNQDKKLVINSAYRTVAQQHILYQLHLKGIVGKAAKPGLSPHEDGLALDVDNYPDWIRILERYGWQYLGDDLPNDPWHFSFDGGRGDIGNIGVKAFQRLWNKHNSDDQIEVDGDFGGETAKRMNKSPSDGFPLFRLLKLTTPLLEGEDVRVVQEALVEAGFLDAGKVNKFYDTETVEAVEAFQKDKGLVVDGKVGPNTRRILLA